MAHVALGVDSTDETFERVLERTDPPVQTEPTTMDDIGVRVAFIEDPDGYVVELVEELE
jgi:lactoylglutathione lyase